MTSRFALHEEEHFCVPGRSVHVTNAIAQVLRHFLTEVDRLLSQFFDRIKHASSLPKE